MCGLHSVDEHIVPGGVFSKSSKGVVFAALRGIGQGVIVVLDPIEVRMG